MTDEQWKRMKVLYGQARQLKSSERSAFLAQACGSDEHLQRQVEALLENSDKANAEGFLETPALAETAGSSWTGRRIARYAVGERIGAGGMGEVYRAKDTKLGRDVALKVLPPSFVQEADRRGRFEREARLLAALNHPHIAAIYGFEDGGVLYEMLSGRLPFPGNSIPETIAGVLGREPDWDALPNTVPDSVDRLLRRCLTKDPKQRMHHIANARIELDEVLSPAAAPARTKTARTRGLMAGAACALLLIAFGAYFLSGTFRGSRQASEPIEKQLTTNTIDDPIVSAAISLDGKYIVYNDSTSIHIRNIEHREVPDTVISGTSEGVPADFCFR
jgi:hypothetical protein